MKLSRLSLIAIGSLLAGCGSAPVAPPPTAPPPPAPAPHAPAPAQAPIDIAPAAPPAAAAPPAPVAEAAAPKEVFPSVYLDARTKTVWFDASVAIDAHNAKTPVVYLEVFACTPDSKEHESLVVTKAKPSHIHAALLLAGVEPGKPGEYDWSGAELKTIPPQGPRLRVRFEVEREGQKQVEDPATWVKSLRSGKSLRETTPGAGFVFAGSLETKRGTGRVYDADMSGTLLGLTTFGTETIAWSDMYNNDSGVEEPQWVADGARVPGQGVAVRVGISAADGNSAP
ncbi:MAG: YdjY domain-containing protein [Phycisphaerales bacterium]